MSYVSNARRRPSSFALAGGTLVCVVSGFLVLPLVVIVVSSFGTDAYLAFPPSGFTLAWYRQLFGLRDFLAPLGVSLRLAALVSVLSAVAGTLAAYAFARQPRLRRTGAETLFLIPIILPSLIVGLSFMVLFNLLGVSNPWLQLTFGHLAITIPMVLQIARSLIATLDQNLESAAQTLGAHPGTVLRKIVLPLLRPAIAGGVILGFALSFDEFVIATLLSSGGVTTFPVELFQYMRFSINPTVAAISTALIAVTCVFVWVLHRVVGLDVLFGLQRSRG